MQVYSTRRHLIFDNMGKQLIKTIQELTWAGGGQKKLPLLPFGFYYILEHFDSLTLPP